MSRCLTERSIDHVVLERGEVANSWRHERWDSLRLLTPNWQSRLPGHRYDGSDPDGFMNAAEVVEFVSDYAGRVEAPVRTHTRVTSVRRTDDGYQVATDQGEWRCRTLVLASGDPVAAITVVMPRARLSTRPELEAMAGPLLQAAARAQSRLRGGESHRLSPGSAAR